MTPNDIAQRIVWKNRFDRKRRLQRIYEVLGFMLFVGLTAGALWGFWKMWH